MATNLIEFLRELLFNDDLRADFADNPTQTLEANGLAHLTADDIHDALVLLQDDEQEGDFSRHYDTGSNHLAVAAAQPVHHGGGGGGHESAEQYLTRYITNNYIDDRDTTIDNSVNQNIDTDGGDFHQDIENDSVNATGDGAVAAGDDISGSTITTGDDNQVGNGNVAGNGNVVGAGNNVVSGDDNTTSFGAGGSATSSEIGGDLTVGDGSAVSGTGPASSAHVDSSIHDSFNDQSTDSVEDSGNLTIDGSDHSTHEVDDSFNNQADTSTHTTNETHDSGNITLDV